MSEVRHRGANAREAAAPSRPAAPCSTGKEHGHKGKAKSSGSNILLFLVLAGVLGTVAWFQMPAPRAAGGFPQEVKDKSKFILPDLAPGEMAKFVWKEDESVIDTNGRIIGLPTELTDEIRKFTMESGLYEAFRSLLYDLDNKLDQGEMKLIPNLKGNRTWAAMTPDSSGNWKNSDMHWVDVADEANYEETLQVLKRGNFDIILDAIGKEFNSTGLMIGGMGFIITSHTRIGNFHVDLPETGGRWWDLLFPLVKPEKAFAGVYIGDEDEYEEINDRIPFTEDVGILLGDTQHATASCDYRDTGEYRVAITIYIIDIGEDNADVIAGDGTAVFPIPNEPNWYLAQAGRAWGNGNTLKNNPGRKPYSPKDERDDCEELALEGYCDTDLNGVRKECLKTCEIFIDDEIYFGELMPALKSVQ